MNIPPELLAIGELLRTQDNLGTAEVAFYVQVERTMYGMDPDYAEGPVWYDTELHEEVPEPSEEEQEQRPGAIIETGKFQHWETKMVSFTKEGAEEYLRQDGHNLRRIGQVRIYGESFRRCPEMIAIRAFLMSLPKPESTPA